ncbi:MAG: oligoendopeptidase F [Anaerolineales bacterium]
MSKETLERDQVQQEDKWRLEALYAHEAEWERDFEAAQEMPEEVAAYSDRLDSADMLAEALQTWFAANRQIERLWVYAHLRSDEDLSNSHHEQMRERAHSLYTDLDTAGSYLAPEILSLDEQTVWQWLQEDILAPYRVWLQDVLRYRPYTLSRDQERLLSMAGEPLAAFGKIFSVLKNVDLAARLPQIENEEGKERQLTHASFLNLLRSKDRTVRKAAYDKYYAEYRGNRQTISATLDGMIKTHIFEARVRGFSSALEAALFEDNVTTSVYNTLISAVHDALPVFYRYMALRKRLLGLDHMHMYDIYVPAVPRVTAHYEYGEAADLICKAVEPLGAGYVKTLRQGILSERWVDRYENVGKRSGAYSSGSYDSMPYILMNYTGDLDSVFTLAHEAGHSMHSWYSNRNQPYPLADYRIFVAEVASTVNESLLTHHLLSTTADDAIRAYLIDRYLDSFRGTLFRQTMFAEFEKTIHAQSEEGQPLTADGLDETYYDLVKHYFGDSMAFDEEDASIAWEWSRIDHFFYNFYVYKYATGMSAAIAIAYRILKEEEGALDDYIAFLKSGRSKYPLELLKDAGVDLTTPKPVEDALAEFEDQLKTLETLV